MREHQNDSRARNWCEELLVRARSMPSLFSSSWWTKRKNGKTLLAEAEGTPAAIRELPSILQAQSISAFVHGVARAIKAIAPAADQASFCFVDRRYGAIQVCRGDCKTAATAAPAMARTPMDAIPKAIRAVVRSGKPSIDGSKAVILPVMKSGAGSEEVLGVLQATLSAADACISREEIEQLTLLAHLLSGPFSLCVAWDAAEAEKLKASTLLAVATAMSDAQEISERAAKSFAPGQALTFHQAEELQRAIVVMETLTDALGAEGGAMYVVDHLNGVVQMLCTHEESVTLQLPLDRGCAAAVVKSRATVHVADASTDSRFDAEVTGRQVSEAVGLRPADVLAVPVFKEGASESGETSVDCVIEMFNSPDGAGFEPKQEAILLAVAKRVARDLLPDLIQDMLANQRHADDHGMDLQEVQELREAVTAEYGVAQGGGVAPGGDALARSSVSALPEIAATESGRLEPIGHIIGHHLGKQLTPREEEKGAGGADAVGQQQVRIALSVGTLPRGLTTEALHSGWQSTWDLDYLSYSPAELLQLAAAVFRASGVVDEFAIPHETVSSFLQHCCSRYHSNPYHNFTHGVHVMTTSYLHARGGIDGRGGSLSKLELLSLLTSAICHDVEHPGVTNAFLVKSGSPLAIQYNDLAVLESMHAATAFRILSRPECNVLGTLAAEQRQAARALIIGNILATDMAHHNKMVRELAEMAASHAPITPAFACKAICHLSDIGNVAMAWDRSEQWSRYVGEEAVTEAQETKRLGLPAAPFTQVKPFTREELAKRTLVFTDLFVYPLYKAAALQFPSVKGRLQQIRANRDECKRVIAQVRLKKVIRVSMQFSSNAKLTHFDDAPAPAPVATFESTQTKSGFMGRWIV